MKYGPIAQRLKSNKPKAKKVHHTEEQVRRNLGIPDDQPLPGNLAEAQGLVERTRPYRYDKKRKKLFSSASKLQHGEMDEYAKEYKKKGEEAETRAVDQTAEQILDEKYDKRRRELVREGREAKKRAKEIEWQKLTK